MLEYLEEYGYCVVRDALRQEEMESIKAKFWDFHEAISSVRRDDPQTWDGNFIAHPATGIISGCGFGQSRFLWALRVLPAVRQAFAAVWDTDDLITSFDGGNAFRSDPAWVTQGGWWHCDQNGTKPGRQGRVCVQGLILLTPANEYTGGFCAVPCSHKDHVAFSERHPWAKEQGDFLAVPEGDPILAAGGRLLRAQAGDLLLWDSRTIHCNSPAIASAEAAPVGAVPPPGELLRLAGYVCFAPARLCSPDVAEQRARAALDLVTSTHWPYSYVPTSQAPEWMGRRAMEDYSPEEVRLILGDHGRWPDTLATHAAAPDPACAAKLATTTDGRVSAVAPVAREALGTAELAMITDECADERETGLWTVYSQAEKGSEGRDLDRLPTPCSPCQLI